MFNRALSRIRRGGLRDDDTGTSTAIGGDKMMKTIFKMTLGLGIMALAAQNVSAQDNRNCAPRDFVLDRLAEGYGETRQSIGLAAQGTVIEVFASGETGSWTIIATMPNGTTCMVASGQSFETVAEALPAKGNDT